MMMSDVGGASVEHMPMMSQYVTKHHGVTRINDLDRASRIYRKKIQTVRYLDAAELF